MERDGRRMSRTFRRLVKMRRLPVPVVFLLSVSRVLNAQEADTLAAARAFSAKMLPVVKPAEQAVLPAAASASGTAEILRRFTGVQVKDYGGVGGLKTVNVRSLGSEHTGIFLDGIQVDNAQNMQVDLGRFSTDGIGSISLYTGQKARRLQTAKEYVAGAAVYMETERPQPSADGSAGKIRLRGGSFGTFQSSLLWDRRIRGTVLRTGAEFLTSSGRYEFPCFDTTLVRENGDIRAVRVEAGLFGTTRQGLWHLHAYSYGSERGFPGPVIRRGTGLPFSAERQADRDFFVQGAWQQDWTERLATAVRFKYADNYTHYDTHPERNPAAMPCDLHFRQRSGYLSLAQSVIVSAPWAVDLATDVQYNTLDADVGRFVSPGRLVFTGAAAAKFVTETFRAAAHLAWQGARDRFRSPQAGGWSREDAFREAWMPGASLFWQPSPGWELSVFAKRSYRLPSFNDLYYTQIGNSDLVPEAAFQTGADIRFSADGGPATWAFRISPYVNRVSEKIVAIPTSSQFRWTMLNIGKVRVTGLDAKAEAGIDRNGWTAGLTLRYSFQQALDRSVSGSPTWGNQVPYIPRHSGAADLTAAHKDWTLSWTTVFTGGRWSRTANIPDYYLEPWSLSSVTLGKKIAVPDSGGRTKMPELTAGITLDNVFDTPYQVVQGYPMPGRSLMASLTLEW